MGFGPSTLVLSRPVTNPGSALEGRGVCIGKGMTLRVDAILRFPHFNTSDASHFKVLNLWVWLKIGGLSISVFLLISLADPFSSPP